MKYKAVVKVYYEFEFEAGEWETWEQRSKIRRQAEDIWERKIDHGLKLYHCYDTEIELFESE